MKILDLVQGSEEWLAARLDYACASEAPVVMGVSKFMARRQLLDAKKGWQKNPDSSFKKRLFEKGHKHEDEARLITEIHACESFPPKVGLIKVGDMEWLASFDGLGEDAGAPWEHKDWNLTLAENVRNHILEPLYYWQLEHQMMVAGVEEIGFTCSDGGHENRVSMIYNSVPERRHELIKGWQQFYIDLSDHELEAKVEVIEAQKAALPAINYVVTGTDISTNIDEVLMEVKQLASDEMSRVLESDLDFANKEQLNKDVKKARAALKETTAKIRGEFVSYSEFEGVAAELDGVLQKMQSHGERQVKEAKDAKKAAIVDDALAKLGQKISSINIQVEPFMIQHMITISYDFVGAMKGKRNLESIQDAVDSQLASVLADIDAVATQVIANVKHLKESTAGYEFLFNDAAALLNQAEESFKAVVSMRMREHKEAEEKRLEQERERIRKEEEERAENKRLAEQRRQEQEQLKSAQEAKSEVENSTPEVEAAPVDMPSVSGQPAATLWSELAEFACVNNLTLQASQDLEDIIKRYI